MKMPRLPFVLFTLFCLIAATCAWLTPAVKEAETVASNVEKHGVEFERCSNAVVKDAIITSANVVASAIAHNVDVAIVAHILQGIAQKEAEGLKACAEGQIPDRLAPSAVPTDPDAGTPPPTGAVESQNDSPTQRF
jgi:hypothetical protein